MAIRRSMFFSFTGLFFVLFCVPPVRALDWTVDIAADENDASCAAGDCSLREAIAAAGNGDTVLFALPGPSPWTITLTAALGQLVLANDIAVTGPGATLLAVSGANLVRVMTVQAGATVTLSGLTLRNGEAKSSGDKHGGCLKVLGEAIVNASRFESCQAWNGGISSNTPGGDGGGVYVAAGGVFTGSLLGFSGDLAGAGGGALSPPTVFAGGRGGALANAGTATLTQTTVANCSAGAGGGPYGPGGEGGGLANLTGGVLRLDGSTLSGNRSGDGATFMGASGADGRGGGLFCAGDCTLNNVTLSGNEVGTSAVGAAAQGGGLFVSAGTTRLRNVTVAGNVANSTGGGLARSGGTIRTRNSLFAGNTGGSSPDCASAATGVVTEGYNLIRVNNGCASSFSGTDQEGTGAAPLEPLLAALAANGGPTETRALGAGSPAIDRGDPSGCASWNPLLAQDEPMVADQRGELRPTDGDGDAVATCDAGAFEAAAVAPVQHLLTVTVAGAGSGDVASVPAGIACPSDCTESWVLTQSVELAATPAPGSYFVGWSGDCSGTGACSFTMSADRAVTATFGPLHTLVVAVAGAGSGGVTSVPDGIACPVDCSEAYPDGTTVSLTATPSAGSFFVGWSVGCTGSGSCEPVLDADLSVTATFGSFAVFSDGFESGDPCAWSATVGGTACPP
jgi:CSLREA domain-containing protein